MEPNEIRERTIKDLARLCLAEFQRVSAEGSRAEIVRMAGTGIAGLGVASLFAAPASSVAQMLIPVDHACLHVVFVAAGAALLLVGGHLLVIGQYFVDSENRKRPPEPPKVSGP